MKKGNCFWLGFLLGTALLVATSASPVFAGDPTFTGITAAPSGQLTQVDPAIPAGYAQQKAAELAAIDSGQLSPAGLAATKTGSGSGVAAQTQAAPLVATCVNGYPCVWYFTSPGLHQMTTIYCVVAFVQSVGRWDLSSWYLDMGTGEQLLAQNQIYAALGSNTINIDTRALPWINTQFSNYSYRFRYDPINPTSEPTFMNYIRMDIYTFVEMNYVRVNLSSGDYGGWKSGGLHATGSTGYNDNTGLVTSYDPYSTRNTDGTCKSTSYGGSGSGAGPYWGCTWTMLQTNYYLAMDTSGGSDYPLWY